MTHIGNTSHTHPLGTQAHAQRKGFTKISSGSSQYLQHTTTAQHKTEQHGTALQYRSVQCSAVQYSTVQYSTAQYSTVQYSTVQ